MKKYSLLLLKVLVIIYVIICVLLYFFQEKIIFFPEKLDSNYRLQFDQKFEEINILTADEKILNGVLFKVEKPKGLIFYLHGNAGSLRTWGEVAKVYNHFNYDVFILDYRGYGKSEGTISSEKQLFIDVQIAYDKLKSIYDESEIIVLGYSIGTGPASQLAATNNPKMLILQAPYYSLKDMMQHNYPIIPIFILKYKFETNNYIRKCKAPVVIFHGDNDNIIYHGSSLKLKQLFKPLDTLIILKGQGHNGMSDNTDYLAKMQEILK